MKKTIWQELRRTEIEAAANANAVVIIPVGAIEQHGNHLPINVDASCSSSIAQRAAQAIDEFPVLVLPVIWTGLSATHMSFPGTITLKFHTFLEVLTQVVCSVHAHGFKKILILNGHGGNSGVVAALRFKLASEEDISYISSIIGYSWWDIPSVHEEIVRVCQSDKGFIGHAAEVETSVELYLQPELVDTSAAVWAPGVWGDPSTATREKGERIVNTAVNALVKVLHNFHSGTGMPMLFNRYQKEIVKDTPSPTLG